MNDNFKKQIKEIEDISEIAQILKESTELRERVAKYQKEPYASCFSVSKNRPPMGFDKKGDTIYLLGDFTGEDQDNSSLLEVLYDAMDKQLITTAHTIKNGLFEALVESCSINNLGFDITSISEISEKEFLFNENNQAILIGLSSEKESKFVDFIYNNGINITLLGHVTKGEFRVDDLSYGFISDYID